MMSMLTVLGALCLATTEEPTESPSELPPASPSLALLQYLGGFEDADGQWLDPTTLPESLEPEDADSKQTDEKKEPQKVNDKR